MLTETRLSEILPTQSLLSKPMPSETLRTETTITQSIATNPPLVGPGSAGPRVGPAASRVLWRAESVLGQSRALLDDAHDQREPGDRFRIAHLAALRAAAALLLSVNPPGTRSARRPTSAWILMQRLAPEFTDWARYFAAHAGQRAAADAGAVGVVKACDAVEMLAAVRMFLDLVDAAVTDAAVGRSGHSVLPSAWGPAQVPPPRHILLSAAS